MNEKEFRAIYDDYLVSGLTKKDYCLNQKMCGAKFFYWQNKLKGVLPPKNGFVPVIFSGNPQASFHQLPVALNNQPERQIKKTPSAAGLSCEICYPNGINVKVNGLTDLEMVRSLVISTHR